MTIVFEERLSDSPYIEMVTHGYTVGGGSTIRPAEINWHMVFTRHDGRMHPLFVGPLTSSGVVEYGGEAEILWIKFKLGVFIPQLPTREFLDTQTLLPEASTKTFWLNSMSWQFPDFENVDTFVDHLARREALVSDPVINAVLQGHPHDLSPRTVRHRFLHATGLPQNHIFQFERAKQAVALLERGTSILDTVYEVGYYDQPHLTRALKQWIGYTPAQIVEMNQSACQNIQDTLTELAYDEMATDLAEVR